VIVRDERDVDRDAIRRVNLAAFGGPEEADLVDTLRREGATSTAPGGRLHGIHVRMKAALDPRRVPVARRLALDYRCVFSVEEPGTADSVAGFLQGRFTLEAVCPCPDLDVRRGLLDRAIDRTEACLRERWTGLRHAHGRTLARGEANMPDQDRDAAEPPPPPPPEFAPGPTPGEYSIGALSLVSRMLWVASIGLAVAWWLLLLRRVGLPVLAREVDAVQMIVRFASGQAGVLVVTTLVVRRIWRVGRVWYGCLAVVLGLGCLIANATYYFTPIAGTPLSLLVGLVALPLAFFPRPATDASPLGEER